MKLDNTSNAAPHAGLPDADVIYLEQVEGGLTRYAAVFSTRIPKVIGPIRSARIADLELLPQYGKLAFAYSGANPELRPVLARMPWYDVSGDRGATGYWRQAGRYPPYNFFGNGVGPAQARAEGAEAARRGVHLRTTTCPWVAVRCPR